jgi:hypothetical protein
MNPRVSSTSSARATELMGSLATRTFWWHQCEAGVRHDVFSFPKTTSINLPGN